MKFLKKSRHGGSSSYVFIILVSKSQKRTSTIRLNMLVITVTDKNIVQFTRFDCRIKSRKIGLN